MAIINVKFSSFLFLSYTYRYLLVFRNKDMLYTVIQLFPGITSGKVPNGELYAQRFQTDFREALCVFRRLRRNLNEKACK